MQLESSCRRLSAMLLCADVSVVVATNLALASPELAAKAEAERKLASARIIRKARGLAARVKRRAEAAATVQQRVLRRQAALRHADALHKQQAKTLTSASKVLAKKTTSPPRLHLTSRLPTSSPPHLFTSSPLHLFLSPLTL